MQENIKIRCTVYTAACLALAVVLRLTLGRIPNADAIFCPLHMPVLLCGYACGASFGFLCGALAPMLGWLVCSLPSPALLGAVTVECAINGLFMGLLSAHIKRKNGKGNFVPALLCALLLGRIVGGMTLGLIYTPGVVGMMTTLGMWLISGLPGLVLQLVILPPLLKALENEALLPVEHVVVLADAESTPMEERHSVFTCSEEAAPEKPEKEEAELETKQDEQEEKSQDENIM